MSDINAEDWELIDPSDERYRLLWRLPFTRRSILSNGCSLGLPYHSLSAPLPFRAQGARAAQRKKATYRRPLILSRSSSLLINLFPWTLNTWKIQSTS
jgi:hypothetical protein